MITASDWNHGTVMNMKEIRLMNTGIYKGQVEHKYDYSANQFDVLAWGWSSTEKHIGIWFVNPTNEYLSGGPTKIELSAHRDATFNVGPQFYNDPAPPCLLNYWRGSHYGSTSCAVAAGEHWTKVIGPFLIYCNAGETPDAMWKDALARSDVESKAWPYEWASGVDYPHKSERGIASGQIVLKDPQAPDAKMTRLLVGLTWPDYEVPSRDGPVKVDWQTDAKHYQFWTRGDPATGRFTIPNIRPGTYTLHAIADGVLGEFVKTDVTIKPGETLDLGQLEWTPKRFGRQLWDIGIPDRTAGEFLHGDDYWHWGLYLKYPKDFPNDVNYVIGKSDFHKDWNYVQVPRATDDIAKADGTATTWTIHFTLPTVPHGKAILRLPICGSAAIAVDVAVNGQPAGSTGKLMYNQTINRDSVHGYWYEKDVVFNASLMKAGENVMTLSIPAGNVMNGVEYDYVRLELDESGGVTITQ
jgi:rhamnogalacturonan endolyase